MRDSQKRVQRTDSIHLIFYQNKKTIGLTHLFGPRLSGRTHELDVSFFPHYLRLKKNSEKTCSRPIL